jgi:hypothetical protein
MGLTVQEEALKAAKRQVKEQEDCEKQLLAELEELLQEQRILAEKEAARATAISQVERPRET